MIQKLELNQIKNQDNINSKIILGISINCAGAYADKIAKEFNLS